jgi:hypothetical protein
LNHLFGVAAAESCGGGRKNSKSRPIQFSIQQQKSPTSVLHPLPKSEALETPFLGSGVLQFKLAPDGTAVDTGGYHRSFEISFANDHAHSSNLAENNLGVISMVG